MVRKANLKNRALSVEPRATYHLKQLSFSGSGRICRRPLPSHCSSPLAYPCYRWRMKDSGYAPSFGVACRRSILPRRCPGAPAQWAFFLPWQLFGVLAPLVAFVLSFALMAGDRVLQL